MRIALLLVLFFASLLSYEIKNSDGDVIFYIGGENNDRISINCGENVDEDYALKVCGKVTATDFIKDTVTLDFKDSDDELEGNETNDNHTAIVTLELNKASSEDITFHFETKDDTADSSDYDKVDKDFTISAGDDSIDIEISIKGDTDVEKDEKIDIEITDVKNADLSDATATYTILNDDEGVNIQMQDPDKTESAKEGKSMPFTVVASEKVSGDTTVKWKILHADTDGTNDDDFDDVTGSVVIKDGKKKADINLKAKDDDLYGVDEHFSIELTDADNDAVINDDDDANKQQGIVENNDEKPTIKIDDPDAVDEGEDIDFTVTIDKAEIDVSFDFATKEDTAKEGDDYDGKSGDDVVISAGDTTSTITISTIDDDDDDDDDSNFVVDLSDLKNVDADDVDGNGTINDNDDSGGGWFSDKRLKKEITPLHNPLQKLQQIQGVTFHWRDVKRGESEEVGVIAQDVEKVYPQVVTTGKDGYKRVKYHLLVAPLIEALKELKKENEDLRQRVKKLESQ